MCTCVSLYFCFWSMGSFRILSGFLKSERGVYEKDKKTPTHPFLQCDCRFRFAVLNLNPLKGKEVAGSNDQSHLPMGVTQPFLPAPTADHLPFDGEQDFTPGRGVDPSTPTELMDKPLLCRTTSERDLRLGTTSWNYTVSHSVPVT